MATANELDSFYQKFKSLVNGNVKATLKVDCEHGKAVVSLTAEIGYIEKKCPYPSQSRASYASVIHRQSRSPSYFRRRERRQEARNKVENVDALHQKTYLDTAAEEAADDVEGSVLNSELNTQKLWAEKANVADTHTEKVVV